MRMLDALNSPRGPKKQTVAPLALGALAALCLMAAIPAAVAPQEQASALVDVLSGGKRSKDARMIQEHMDAWLTFNKDITKIASADDVVLKVPNETVQKRSIRLVPASVGRTVITLTYADGTTEQLVFTVKRDLSVLEAAMKSVHPSIEVDIAPDRDAIMLTGLVPDGSYSARAAQAASDYASASRSDAKASNGKVINLIRVQEAATNLEQRLQGELARLGGQDTSVRRIQQGAVPDDAKDVFVVSGSLPDVQSLERASALARAATNDTEGKRVVSQLQTNDRPTSIEQVIERSIHEQVGATKVKVSRVAQLDVSGDMDILVLTGSVPNQTALVQTLTLASKVFQQQELVKKRRAGEIQRVTETFAGGLTRTTESPLSLRGSSDDIRVSADEGGALRTAQQSSSGQDASSGISGILGGGGDDSGASFGSDVIQLLDNQLNRNIGRSKAIELADGRILSFLKVDDLPQIRISIKLYEINRNALLKWDANVTTSLADFDVNSNSRPAGATPLTGDSPPIGVNNGDIQNIVGFLEGTATNQLLIGGDHFSLNSVFKLLESEGLARTLSSPTLTVLAGEVAAFGDGGTVPIPTSITTQFGTSTGGIVAGTQQLSFGVQLAVRPLVDEDGYITLDLVPSVSKPDLELTALVRTTTGSPQQAVAFSRRSMRTSARLRDGETLLIGGLTEHSKKDSSDGTPFLSKVPVLGWLFSDKKHDDSDRELIITVNPTIVRDRNTTARLWAFPSASELMPRASRKSSESKAAMNDSAK